MPDAALYLKGALAAAGVSALCVLVVASWRRPDSRTRSNLAAVLGVGLGLGAGYSAMRLRLAWPPANALGRFLLIVLPVVLLGELLAGLESVPRRVAWLLRLAIAAAAGPVLLYRSVYVAGANPQWTPAEAGIVFAGTAALLFAEWSVLSSLCQRTSTLVLPFALAMASLCGGMAIMLAGYLGGGAATLPLAASLAGAAAANAVFNKQPASAGISGIGLVGLYSLLLIGRFFGELPSAAAFAVFLSPLMCCASELPILRNRGPWLKAAIGLTLAAIPLAIVLALAKTKFDQEMAPLLR